MKTPKTRAEMIEFLSSHFRYSTMNDWNNATSYAANVKLRNLKIPHELQDRAYAALECEETFDDVNMVLEEFARAHDWRYQILFNGRSGGYLVLYQGGGRKVSEYKSYCTNCGQRNFRAVEDGGNVCGVCNKPRRVNHVFYETFTNGAGMGSRHPEDYADASTEELRAEVKLVREFDAAVEEARRAFIARVQNSEVVEETYTVEKTRKVLKEKA